MAVGATVSRKANGYSSATAYQMYVEANLTGNVSGLQRQVHIRVMGLATSPGGYQTNSSSYAYTDYNNRQVRDWWPRGTWIVLVETWVYVNGNQTVWFGGSFNSNSTGSYMPLNGSWGTGVNLWIPAVWSAPSIAGNAFLPDAIAETQAMPYNINVTSFNAGTGTSAKHWLILRWLNPNSNIWTAGPSTSSTASSGNRTYTIPSGSVGKIISAFPEMYHLSTSGNEVYTKPYEVSRAILPTPTISSMHAENISKETATISNVHSDIRVSGLSQLDAFEKDGINIPVSNLEQGGRAYSNGNAFASDTFCRTKSTIPVNPGDNIGLLSDFDMAIDSGFLFYDFNGIFIIGTNAGTRVAKVPQNAFYCDINIQGTGNPSDITNLRVVKSGYTKVRYIRIYQNGSNENTGNHLCQVEAYDRFGINRALGKIVTGHAMNGSPITVVRPDVATLSSLTGTYADINSGGARCYFQIDLGAEYDIKDLRVWRYYPDSRTYYESAIWGYDENNNRAAVWHEYGWDGLYQELEGRGSIPFRLKDIHGLTPNKDYIVAAKVKTSMSSHWSPERKIQFLTQPNDVEVANLDVLDDTSTSVIVQSDSTSYATTDQINYKISDSNGVVMDVSRGTVGKNLFSSSLEFGSLNGNNPGDNLVGNTRMRSYTFDMLEPDTQYIINSTGLARFVAIHQYDSDFKFIHNSAWQDIPYTFTSLPNANYYRLIFRMSDNSTMQPSYVQNIQVEKGATPTTYEPFLREPIYNDLVENLQSGIEYTVDMRFRTTRSNVWSSIESRAFTTTQAFTIPFVKYIAPQGTILNKIGNLVVGDIYMNATYGNLAENSNTNRFKTQDYIPVIEGQYFNLAFNNINNARVLLYDENKDFISLINGNNWTDVSWVNSDFDFIIPKNIHFIRLTFRNSNNAILSAPYQTNYNPVLYNNYKRMYVIRDIDGETDIQEVKRENVHLID